MTSARKILIIIPVLFSLLLVLSGFALARELEVPLPQMEQTTTPLLPDYIKYIFNFAIGIGGLIAFLALVYGGTRYLTSAGNPSAMSDANNQIFSALLGLVLLLGSWLILTTINPQLIVINPQKEPTGLTVSESPGVYLCKDSTSSIVSADCQLFTKSAAELRGFNDQAKYVKFQNDDRQFGAVLHQDKDYGGRCRVCLNDGCDISYVKDVSSVTVFSQASSGEGQGVTFYERDNFDEKGWHAGPFTAALPYLNWGQLVPSEPPTQPYGRSIKIENEGKYLVALYEGEGGQHRCEVFTRSDSGLASNPIGTCGGGSNQGCFRSVTILPIKTKF